MPGIGPYKRSYPRLNVLRGWDPQQPNHFASDAPVADDAAEILSGMVISKKYNATTGLWEWQRGWETGNGIPHFAIEDGDNYDSAEAGILNGLSCAGQFRIRTPFYTETAVDLNEGALLVPDGTTGKVKAVANAAGILVIGIVGPNMYGPKDISDINSEATPDGNGQVLVIDLDTTYLPMPA